MSFRSFPNKCVENESEVKIVSGLEPRYLQSSNSRQLGPLNHTTNPIQDLMLLLLSDTVLQTFWKRRVSCPPSLNQRLHPHLLYPTIALLQALIPVLEVPSVCAAPLVPLQELVTAAKFPLVHRSTIPGTTRILGKVYSGLRTTNRPTSHNISTKNQEQNEATTKFHDNVFILLHCYKSTLLSYTFFCFSLFCVNF